MFLFLFLACSDCACVSFYFQSGDNSLGREGELSSALSGDCCVSAVCEQLGGQVAGVAGSSPSLAPRTQPQGGAHPHEWKWCSLLTQPHPHRFTRADDSFLSFHPSNPSCCWLVPLSLPFVMYATVHVTHYKTATHVSVNVYFTFMRMYI